MSITSISQLDPNKRYSYADYLMWRLKERVELIRGKLFRMSPAPSRLHQQIAGNLHGFFWNHLRGKRCQVFSAPFDVRFPKKKTDAAEATYTVVQPDLCVVCDTEKLDDRGCLGPPDLIIEILSPGNTQKEMREKFDLYEESGVLEYWLVEPNDRTVFVYLLDETDRYRGIRPFVAPDHLSTSLFPDLSIDLQEVFADPV